MKHILYINVILFSLIFSMILDCLTYPVSSHERDISKLICSFIENFEETVIVTRSTDGATPWVWIFTCAGSWRILRTLSRTEARVYTNCSEWRRGYKVAHVRSILANSLSNFHLRSYALLAHLLPHIIHTGKRNKECNREREKRWWKGGDGKRVRKMWKRQGERWENLLTRGIVLIFLPCKIAPVAHLFNNWQGHLCSHSVLAIFSFRSVLSSRVLSISSSLPRSLQNWTIRENLPCVFSFICRSSGFVFSEAGPRTEEGSPSKIWQYCFTSCDLALLLGV